MEVSPTFRGSSSELAPGLGKHPELPADRHAIMGMTRPGPHPSWTPSSPAWTTHSPDASEISRPLRAEPSSDPHGRNDELRYHVKDIVHVDITIGLIAVDANRSGHQARTATINVANAAVLPSDRSSFSHTGSQEDMPVCRKTTIRPLPGCLYAKEPHGHCSDTAAWSGSSGDMSAVTLISADAR